MPRRDRRSADTPALFAEYAGRVLWRLGDRVDWVCTINEANTPLQLTANGLLSDELIAAMRASFAAAAPAFGVAPDEFGVFFTATDETSLGVIAGAHRLAVEALHAERSDARAGITLSLQQAEAEPGGEAQAEAFDEAVNQRFLREMGAVGDFVGVQNYSRLRFGPAGLLPRTENVTGAGLELVPSSLAATCQQAHELTGLPVLISTTRRTTDASRSSRPRCASLPRRSRTVWTCAATCTGA